MKSKEEAQTDFNTKMASLLWHLYIFSKIDWKQVLEGEKYKKTYSSYQNKQYQKLQVFVWLFSESRVVFLVLLQ